MATLGFVSPSSDGHLNPSLTLAGTLVNRGHRVVFYCLSDGLVKVKHRGFMVRPYATNEFPEARILESYRELGRLKGMRAVRFTIDHIKHLAQIGLRELPALFRADKLDGVIVDQILPDAAIVARAEKIPFVTVCNALPMNPDDNFPPVFSCGQPGRGPWPWLRNRLLNGLTDRLAATIMPMANKYQVDRGLAPYTHPSQIPSRLAQITQIPQSFDFARRQLENHFHYTAPFHSNESRSAVDFPWDRIDDRKPLIYASMGTLQNQIFSVFDTIADACRDLPFQLVISQGIKSNQSQPPKLAGEPIIVGYAPQLELLSRASLCITHAGLNTALESLTHGVPMLAIPVTNDQPGVAARIAWGKMGRMIPVRKISVGKLKVLLAELISNRIYMENAKAIQHELSSKNGPELAAEIIEQAIKTDRPVLKR